MCSKLKAGKIDTTDISPDSPVPFDLRRIWYDLYQKEHATLNEKDDWNTIAYKKDGSGKEIKGDLNKAIEPQFEPPGPGGAKPFKTIRATGFASYLNKIQTRLRDSNYNFLLTDNIYDGVKNDLSDLVGSWLNHDFPITVLDLGGIPFEITDLVVGVVSRILFENAFWGRTSPGIGKQRPLLCIYEEAHGYLPKGGSGQFVSGYASKAVRRIFKEGRKYGIGAIVVSQRPSEVDDTILSQCGTFFALRLTNSEDQGRVRSMVPDSLTGLVEMLPALRTGETLILGEAVQIPSRVRLPLIEPRPNSGDPEPAKRWRETKIKKPEYEKVITSWRKQKMDCTSKKEEKKDGKNTGSIK
jgi:DNA helicase HerA-like ATPase